MLAGSCTCLSEYSDAVSIVYNEPRRMRVAQIGNARDVGKIAFHAEHTVDDYHLRPADRTIQPRFEMCEVAVAEADYFRTRQRGTIDHTGMVELVDQKNIA